jgi:hypothetical protein
MACLKGQGVTVRDLCQLVKEKKPNCLFLMETKSRKNMMERLRVKMGFEGLFVVEPMGRSGGLALMWKEADEFEIQNYTLRHINAVVKPTGQATQWRFTGFYGHPEAAKRYESWALLNHLKDFLPEAWLCVPDFNEVVEQGEKV